MNLDSKEYARPELVQAAGIPQATLAVWRMRHGLLKATRVRYSLLDVCVVRTVAVLARYSFKLDDVVNLADGPIRKQLADLLRKRMRGQRDGTIIRLFDDKEKDLPATLVWIDLANITDHVIDALGLHFPVKKLSPKERIKQLDQVLQYIETPQFQSRVEALRELWAVAGPQNWRTIATMLGVPTWVVAMALRPESGEEKPTFRPIVDNIAKKLGVSAESIAA